MPSDSVLMVAGYPLSVHMRVEPANGQVTEESLWSLSTLIQYGTTLEHLGAYDGMERSWG